MFEFGPFVTYSESTDFGHDAVEDAGAGSVGVRKALGKEISHGFDQGFYGDQYAYPSNATDTGAGTDDATLAVTHTNADSGASTQSSTLTVEHVEADSGASSDQHDSLEIFDADSGSASDQHDSLVKDIDVNESDAGSSQENQDVDVVVSSSDANLFASEKTVGVTRPATEEHGAGDDSADEEVSAEISDADSGAGSESEGVSLSQADTGGSNDVATPVENEITGSDQASGVDSQLAEASIIEADAAAGAEQTPQRDALIFRDDVGTGVGQADVAVAVTSTETASSVDDWVLGKQSSDTGSGVDTESLVAAVNASDAAAGTDASTFVEPGEESLDTGPYYAAVLKSQPWVYYRLGEISGNLVYDQQSRAPGIYYGTPTHVNGLVAGENTAIEFDGDDYAEFGDVWFDYDEFSLELIGRDLDGSVLQKFNELEVTADAGTMTFRVTNFEDETAYECSVDAIGGHFVFVVVGGVARLWHDGVEVDSHVRTAEDYDGAGAMRVGENMTGVVDEISMYRRPLSDAEIISHYEKHKLVDDLAQAFVSLKPAFYARMRGLDEHFGAFDNTGSATVVDGPHKSFNAQVPASSIAGQVTYDVLDALADLETWTVGFFARFASSPTTQDAVVFDDAIQFDGGDVTFGGATFNRAFDTDWHFYSFVFDGTNLTLYVDGVEVGGEVAAPSLADGIEINGPVELAEMFVTERPLEPVTLLTLWKLVTHGRADVKVQRSNVFEILDQTVRMFAYEDNLVGA